MSTMTTIISTVITTCGMAPTHDNRPRIGAADGKVAPPRSQAGGARCPPSRGRPCRPRCDSEQGGLLMRGRLFAVVLAVVLVAVALVGGRSPADGQAKPGVKKLDLAHVTPPPESSGVVFKWMCEELTKRSGGSLNAVFHGGTLLTK